MREIRRERSWQPIGDAPVAGLSPAQRFGFTEPSPGPTGPTGDGGLAWNTPPGWSERAPSGMRRADFVVGGDPRAECYLVTLGGGGGGLLANVNRWRDQMSLPPIDEAQLAEAERVAFLGTEALLVDFEGTFTGMGGDQEGEAYRLLGLVGLAGGEARFLKLTGPTEVVARERDAFLSLAASFHEGHAAGGATASAVERGPGGLAWTAPAAWNRAPDRAMREVTFELGGAEDGPAAECYVAILGGNGGGALANVNRWRSQLELAPLSEDDFEQLERIPMLGTEAVLVQADGTYRGMGDELVEEAGLLGAVCMLPDRAVFVKLVGPASTVRAARDDFVAFCRSLRRAS